VDASAVGFDDRAGDSEPEVAAATIPAPAAIDSLKSQEDPLGARWVCACSTGRTSAA
jgi:hypothetical protein